MQNVRARSVAAYGAHAMLPETMKASLPCRISSIVLLLFAAGHTLGFRQIESQVGVDSPVQSMIRLESVDTSRLPITNIAAGSRSADQIDIRVDDTAGAKTRMSNQAPFVRFPGEPSGTELYCHFEASSRPSFLASW
jgi:hypothetical protein